MESTLVRLAVPEGEVARTGLVLLHGRGSRAADMAGLAAALRTPSTVVVAPDAPGGSWYPYRFLVKTAMNEPWLGRALEATGKAVRVLAAEGVPPERIVVAGFSQGACLACEFVARNPGRFGGLVAFAGALIGPDPHAGGYAGDLRGTPALLAVGEADLHVEPAYVRASGEVLESLGAVVTVRVRPGMGHTIHPADVEAARALLEAS